MGINNENDMAGDLQIGPTDQGMVRIFVSGEGFELPFDFDPEEAEEIARELIDAAGMARAIAEGGAKGGKPRGKR